MRYENLSVKELRSKAKSKRSKVCQPISKMRKRELIQYLRDTRYSNMYGSTKKIKTIRRKDWDNMYLEYNQGNSTKFWEITRNKTKITTRWGQQSGRSRELTKDYGTMAREQYHKLIDAKKKKGYISYWKKPKRIR